MYINWTKVTNTSSLYAIAGTSMYIYTLDIIDSDQYSRQTYILFSFVVQNSFIQLH
jgi:hypothetical protein